MKKAPDAFRTISEVSEILDTPAHVLRFWESKFYQVRPVKRAGGRRYYRPDDLALIAGIKHLLQDRGMTIRGVQKIMQEEGVRHVIGLGRSTGRLAQVSEAEAPAPEPATEAPPAAPAEPPSEPAPEDFAVEMEAPTPAAHETAPPPPAAPETAPPPAAPEAAQAAQPDSDSDPDPLPQGPRLAQLLRRLPPEAAPAARLAPIAQRLDRLLDRMAEASGTRRW